MLRADLADAREAWLRAAEHDGSERQRRTQSDFLIDKNHEGEILDFHSLRHTCGAWLAMAGAHPKAVQAVMRHSTITLTMDTYGHLFPGQEAETVARLPDMLGDAPGSLRATGTADAAGGKSAAHAQRAVRQTTRTGASRREQDGPAFWPGTSPKPLHGAEIRNAPRSDARRCDNAPPGTRTPDPLIKSQLLCQLS